MGLAEHQLVADVGDILAVTYHLEIPRAILGVAIHHRTHQLVFLQHQFLVHAAGGIVHQDFIGFIATA